MDILRKLKFAKDNSVPSKYLYIEDGDIQSPYLTVLATDKFSLPTKEQNRKVIEAWKFLNLKMGIEKYEFINMFLTPLIPEDMSEEDEEELVTAR